MTKLLIYIFLFVSSFTFSQNQLISVLYEAWNGTEWVNGSRTSYIYADAASEKPFNRIMENYINGAWVKKTLLEDFNQIDGKIFLESEFEWNTASNGWVYHRKKTHSYSTDNTMHLGYIGQLWLNGAWVLENREGYFYNQEGLQNETIYFTWDEENQLWAKDWRDVRSYDANDVVLETQHFSYENNWIPYSLITYTYTPFGEISLLEEGQYVNGELEPSRRENKTFDNDELLVHQLTEGWDSENENWRNVSNVSFSNNPDGTLHQFVAQEWSTANAWTNLMRATYTYGTSVLGTEEKTVSDFKMYPNPAENELQFAFGKDANTTISLLDLQGKILYISNFQGANQTISLEGIPAGVYLVKVERDGKIDVERFVKK